MALQVLNIIFITNSMSAVQKYYANDFSNDMADI
jgi:hypothetical protein